MTTMDNDRRRDSRVKMRVPVEFYTEGSESPLRSATSDLSVVGCYIETIFPFPLGTKLELKLQLDDTVLALGTVVTSDPQVGNGIEFTRMLPEDMEQLKTFLEEARKTAEDKTE
jgi:c-di-GMP-binding flagellar brake protein YcgR